MSFARSRAGAPLPLPNRLGLERLDDALPLVLERLAAALNGHADMCKLLMSHGATFPEADSEKGIQLKGYCVVYGHAEVLSLLETAWSS